MRPAERLGVAGAVAVLLGALTMMPITQDRGYLGWSLLLVLALGLTAAIARRTAVGEVGAAVGQLVVLTGSTLTLARMLSPGVQEVVPLDALGSLTTSAATHMQTQSAPMSPHSGVEWLMVTAVGVAMVLTDLLVVTLQRHVWGFAPGLTLFLIPALSLRDDVFLAGGLAIVVGYLGILVAEGINRTERWRRGVLDEHGRRPRPVAPVLWGSAALVAVPAVVLALIAWLAIPTGGLGMFTSGRGSGNGGPLQLSDPTLDLRRNLTRPDDVTILSYTTRGGDPDAARGVHLRIASLPRFDAKGWQNTEIQVLPGQPGDVPGVTAVPERRRTTTISIGNFDSEYLPLPYAPRRIDVPGDWGYDPLSLVYIATGNNRDTATRNIHYTVQSADLVPDPDRLSTARAGRPDDVDETGSLPDDLPEEIRQLAFDITADAPTDALKAAAIQSYLRSGEFTYSTLPAPGSGYEALTNFLFVDKQGYCEQFAAAMAVLARVVGIPSRVAIGFLPGERVGDHWEVSTHDLHSWPELYFQGLGWVRWEPTPGNGATPPPWTIARQGSAGESSAPTTTETTASEDATDLPTVDLTTGPDSSDIVTAPAQESEGSGLAAVAVLAIGLAVVVLLMLLAIPGLLRERRRRVRMSRRGGPPVRIEGAWSEVRDTVLDHRGTWPAGSPRAIGGQLSHGMPAEDADDVGTLAVLVERARYAPRIDDSDAEGVVELTDRVRRAVVGPASRGQRFRARWWPRSLWQGGTLREALRRPGRAGRREL